MPVQIDHAIARVRSIPVEARSLLLLTAMPLQEIAIAELIGVTGGTVPAPSLPMKVDSVPPPSLPRRLDRSDLPAKVDPVIPPAPSRSLGRDEYPAEVGPVRRPELPASVDY